MSLDSISIFLDLQPPEFYNDDQNLSVEIQDRFKQPKDQTKEESPRVASRNHPNHNSQKHTVTTLKKLILIDSLKQDSPDQCIARHLWKLFKGAKIHKNKQLLMTVFGCEELSSSEQQNMFKHQGFEDLLNQPIQLIKKAQQILRQLVLQQLTQQVLTKYIETTRIKEKLKFKQYLQIFLEKLQHGSIKGRITPQRS